jgi:phosphatidylethanolamine N-methyltransferase
LTSDNLDIDRSLYSISLIPPVSALSEGNGSASGLSTPRALCYTLGSPIHIIWTAPAGHSRKDWIGLYRIMDLDDRDVTKIASRGHWMPVSRAEYDDGRSRAIISAEDDGYRAKGEVSFSGDTLVWRCGVYEARYHHDGKHNVMAISRKFEIIMDKPVVSTTEEIELHLTPFLRNCFPADAAPRGLDDPLHLGKEKQKETISKRIVYGIREMSSPPQPRFVPF